MSQQEMPPMTSDSPVPSGRIWVNYKMTLAQWLLRNQPSTRRKQIFESQLLHPTEYVRALIHGMINVVFDMIASGKSHRFLLNYENYLLSDDGTMSARVAAIEDADEYDQCVIKVTLAFTNRQNVMDDDDLALKKVIKEILDVNNNNSTPLPPEWVSFMALFDDWHLNRDLIRSHPCLWNWKKRLNFFLNVEHLYNGSTPEVERMVHEALRSLTILGRQHQYKWRLVTEVPLKKVLDNGNNYNYPTSSRFVIKYIRNMIVHVNDRIWNREVRDWKYKNIDLNIVDEEKYRRKNYLDHKLSELFPDLLIEIHTKLLDVGFKW